MWKVSFIQLLDNASNSIQIQNADIYKGSVLGNDILKDLSSGDFEINGTILNPIVTPPTDEPTEVTVNEKDKTKTNTDINSTDYIFKASDKEYLTEDDVRGMSKEQLALARNEIFARHGYVFNDEQYKKYFSAKS